MSMHSVLIEYIFHGFNIIQWLQISISLVYELNRYQIINFRDQLSISPLGPIINGVIKSHDMSGPLSLSICFNVLWSV